MKKKTYVLIGSSGTGKSFLAQNVAKKYHIPLIIDDGLLIKNGHILAGYSAKLANNLFQSIKIAVFSDTAHQKVIQAALSENTFKKILILGTSLKMVQKIQRTLNLPKITNILYIEHLSTKKNIQEALKIRKTRHEHIIPITKDQLQKIDKDQKVISNSLLHFNPKDIFSYTLPYQKTVIRPRFESYSNSSMEQSLMNLLYSYDQQLTIYQINIKQKSSNQYSIQLYLDKTQRSTFLPEKKIALEQFIASTLLQNWQSQLADIFIKFIPAPKK